MAAGRKIHVGNKTEGNYGYVVFLRNIHGSAREAGMSEDGK
jgi:hypothetical protein